MKALIVYFGSQGGMPKMHDISFLFNQVKNIIEEKMKIKINNDLMMIANSLTKYGVVSKYPSEMEIDEKQTKQAIRGSKEIVR